MNAALEQDLMISDLDQALAEANLAPLRPYLDDPEVFEVRVNKFGQVVCDTVKGRRIHDDPRISEDYLSSLTDFLLHLNELPRAPISYVKMPDGARGTFCWPPAVEAGTMLMTIRKHLPVQKSLAELDSEGRFAKVRHRRQSEQMMLEPFEERLLELLEDGDIQGFLRLAVQTKRNIAIAGPTGSGKSTLTWSLLGEVHPTERVLLLADVHEIKETHLNETGFLLYGDKEGRLSASECLKLGMRLSPDRILLTELRDDAAWDYLAGANTGHPGGIFSIHANSAASTPARIATLVKGSEVGRLLDYEVIMRTINATLDVVVYMEKREVLEILYDPLFKKQQMMMTA
ncbi:ATPase, T2SS/T4P/T4SS family [Pseudomonas aeruginosa]